MSADKPNVGQLKGLLLALEDSPAEASFAPDSPNAKAEIPSPAALEFPSSNIALSASSAGQVLSLEALIALMRQNPGLRITLSFS